jgi:hypothetical protein
MYFFLPLLPCLLKSEHTILSGFITLRVFFVINGNFKADKVAILGAFEKLQKVSVIVVMNVSCSVDPHRIGRIFLIFGT